MELVITLITWLTLCLLVAAWGRGRGHAPAGVFFLSLFFSPLAGVTLVLWQGIDQRELDKRLIDAGRKRRCPACAELVNPGAKICPHCRVQYKPAP
jgi:hypothetical protein